MPGKPWATITHIALLVAYLIGVVITAATAAAGQLDPDKARLLLIIIPIAAAAQQGLYAIGKGIAHLGPGSGFDVVVPDEPPDEPTDFHGPVTPPTS